MDFAFEERDSTGVCEESLASNDLHSHIVQYPHVPACLLTNRVNLHSMNSCSILEDLTASLMLHVLLP